MVVTIATSLQADVHVWLLHTNDCVTKLMSKHTTVVWWVCSSCVVVIWYSNNLSVPVSFIDAPSHPPTIPPPHTHTHIAARIYVCTSQILTFPPNVNRSCVTITLQDNNVIAGREQRIGVVFTLLTGDAVVAQSMTTTIVADDEGEHCVSVWLGNTM